jgi:hypothetical protein
LSDEEEDVRIILSELAFMTGIYEDNRRLTYLHTPEAQKRKRKIEGEIDYDGLSDEEEEDWLSQQQGM